MTSERTFTKNQVKRKLQNEGITRSFKVADNRQRKQALSYNKDGSQTSSTIIQMTKEQIKSADFVLKAHGFDSDEFELVSAVNNFWQQNNTEQGLVDLYQSKITVKPKLKEIDIASFLSDIKPVSLQTVKQGKRNLVIPIADWHFGITTYSDIEYMLAEIVEIISKGYNTIVIEQLGDLFHSSQLKKSVTMNDTRLDDVDMEKAVEDARRFFDVLLTECVRHSKQTVIEHAEGNHSGNLEYMFLLYLEARYPDIKVNYHNKYRTAYLLDQVGIFITHGQYAKKKDLPLLFATEFTDIWSQATCREIHTGHLHQKEVHNYQGVTHRQMGTIKKNDNYEIENGWTMNDKGLELFEYSSNRLKTTYLVGGD